MPSSQTHPPIATDGQPLPASPRMTNAQRALRDIMTPSLHTLPPDAPLGEAARMMANLKVSSLFVFDGPRAVGIVTERDMLRELSAGADATRPVSSVMSTPVMTADDSTPFVEAWAQMSNRGVRHLLVTDGKGQPVGMVSESDFRRHIDVGLLSELGELTELMEQTLPAVPPEASVEDALRVMSEKSSSYVVVLDNQIAVGLLTERDVPALLVQANPEALRTGNVMAHAHRPVHAVHQDTWIMEAAATMQRLRVRHLGVVDAQNRLIGMLHQHRLMNRLGARLQNWYLTSLEHAERAQAQLAQERYRLAAEAAQLGYWDYDVVADRILYSEQLLQLMGADPTIAHRPLDIHSLLQRIHSDHRPEVKQQVKRLLSGDPEARLDARYPVLGLDGQWRWVHTRGRVTERDAAGNPTRASGVTMDVQRQMESERALRDAHQEIDHRQQMQELLSDSVNRSPVVAMIWSLKPGWPVEFVTDNVTQWGYDRNAFLQGALAYESLIHPDDRARVKDEITRHIREGQDTYDQTYRLRSGDGRWLWLEDHTRIQRDSAGNMVRAHGMLTDVTARHFEQVTGQIERNALEGLARGADLQMLMQQLLREYENLMEGSACSVLLLDSEKKHLTVLAAPSLPAAYSAAIEGALIGPNAGACGTAAHTGQTVVSTDIATDPLWADYRELAQAHGLRACWSVPIKASDQTVLGTFAIYPRNTQAPLAHEIRAMERTAYLLGLAVERSRDQDTLNKLRLAVEQSPHSIVITDLKSNIEYANQAFFRVTGYSAAEVLGTNPRVLKSGKTDPRAYVHMWDTLAQGLPWQGEFINRRKDGSEYVESVRISPVKQANGRVTHYLAIKEDITQRKEAEQQIHRLAYFDTLTGLPNRQLLTDRFGQALSMARRQGQPLTLMFIDLDHFKNINDTLGHPAGDQLLVETTRRLLLSLRAEDTLSRQGGDEFVLLLPNCGPVQAAQVAEKLMASHAESVRIEDHDVTVTMSIGIALYPSDGTDFNSLSKAADVAMYRAKEEGRNAYRFFTADMQVRSSRTLTLESHLRRALERNELQLVYQPQVSLADGQLVGVEALVRWHHPTLGVVSPGEFIPMAESSGLILPIGEWVLRTAVQQAKAWLQMGLGKRVMAVNLSAVQFRHAGLSLLVDEVLKEHQLPPECLELELTESVAMSDPLGAVVAMDEIGALGVRMAIDDFGTGYSSLSYLKRFKVAKLKIDKSFVQDITSDPDDKAIASAIIGLASSLGLRTIAEGVETPGQLAWLRMQGCDEAQGYLFSPPVTADALVRWAQDQGLVSLPAQAST